MEAQIAGSRQRSAPLPSGIKPASPAPRMPNHAARKRRAEPFKESPTASSCPGPPSSRVSRAAGPRTRPPSRILAAPRHGRSTYTPPRPPRKAPPAWHAPHFGSAPVPRSSAPLPPAQWRASSRQTTHRAVWSSESWAGGVALTGAPFAASDETGTSAPDPVPPRPYRPKGRPTAPRRREAEQWPTEPASSRRLAKKNPLLSWESRCGMASPLAQSITNVSGLPGMPGSGKYLFCSYSIYRLIQAFRYDPDNWYPKGLSQP